MKVDSWSASRPVSPWLPSPQGRDYVHDTGTFRFGKPEVHHEECTMCGLCWIYCPEGAITRDGGKIVIDYEDCRGCGMCAHECPLNLIEMLEEIE